MFQTLWAFFTYLIPTVDIYWVFLWARLCWEPEDKKKWVTWYFLIYTPTQKHWTHLSFQDYYIWFTFACNVLRGRIITIHPCIVERLKKTSSIFKIVFVLIARLLSYINGKCFFICFHMFFFIFWWHWGFNPEPWTWRILPAPEQHLCPLSLFKTLAVYKKHFREVSWESIFCSPFPRSCLSYRWKLLFFCLFSLFSLLYVCLTLYSSFI